MDQQGTPFNFVDGILGLKGNSLKHVEATTGCRVYIRGKRSIKDHDKRGRPSYEHLNEPLHILIEADLPPCVVDLRMRQAQEVIHELLKPMVSFLLIINSLFLFHYFKSNLFFYSFETLSFYFGCIN
uniref:KHDC4/BBP-like KH-domain type I domain-containing protein n=1 Tax=Lactuca sativa TaxID=4236 RepID=A0A9R1WI04_LACSA|nr:hypothetical protein LSAT_V11C200090150 [Lactuca sativa]